MFLILTRRALVNGAMLVATLVAAVALLAWQPGRIKEDYAPAVAIMAAAQTVPPEIRPVYSVNAADKVVALTFDISWGEAMAPKVLDVLKAHNQRATFFLSGPWARNHTDLVARIVADGHEIASHGQKHDNLSGLGRTGVIANIEAADGILREMTGAIPRYLRPPNGDFNTTSLIATREAGYQTIMWSIDSLDWKNPGVDAITNRVLNLAHPGGIVLMHASDSCKLTDRSLPAILQGLRGKGYTAVTVGELLSRYTPDPRGCIRTPGRPGC